MDLESVIAAYWDGRATTYSNGVKGELDDRRRAMWAEELVASAESAFEAAQSEGRIPRALDLGCGPGFFSILLAELGCKVDAVDASEEMLSRARDNAVSCNQAQNVSFHACDILSLPFDDDTFDIVVERNVTWLMRDPVRAYAEWLRVLRPGGKLVVFDANWYIYLVDPEVEAARRADRENNVLEGWDDDAQASQDEEERCEEIAAALPLTPVVRPKWDLETLVNLGAASVSADEDAWLRVWTESEQAYYRSTPLFKVEAVK